MPAVTFLLARVNIIMAKSDMKKLEAKQKTGVYIETFL